VIACEIFSEHGEVSYHVSTEP